MSEQPTPAQILQTGLGFWVSKTLLSAIELGLFTELAAAPLSYDDLQSRVGLHPRSARDFFDRPNLPLASIQNLCGCGDGARGFSHSDGPP